MYRKKTHLHFVGIGGIGMSGIAKILKYQGYHISGCDLNLEQKSIEELRSLGCPISGNHCSALCNDDSIDVLVYSSDIKLSRPDTIGTQEILAAQKKGIPTIGRGLMLAELMRTKFSIGIAGSHGKTTTTSMISHILIEAEMDPTVIVGGHLKNISSHARLGKGDFLVAETDESDRSFLYLNATLAVVTNIDREHLDTYSDIDDIKETFKRFLNNIPFYGKAILCVDDPNVRAILPLPHLKIIKYSLDNSADIYGVDVELEADHSRCTVMSKHSKDPLGHLEIYMPGRHNVLNALAATTLALELGIPFATISKAFLTFKGVDRRFSLKGTFQGAEIFDDYGHHPIEIYNTLLVAKKRTKNKLIVVFQPHRFTRTHKLWDQFVDILGSSNIDHLILTDIYPASEQAIPEITSENLTKALLQKNPSLSVSYVPLESDFMSIHHKLKELAQPDDLILLQGAGKVNKLADKLIN